MTKVKLEHHAKVSSLQEECAQLKRELKNVTQELNEKIESMTEALKDKDSRITEIDSLRSMLEESQADNRELAATLNEHKSRLLDESRKQDKMFADQKALRDTLREGALHCEFAS